MGRTGIWHLGLVSVGVLALASGLGCQPNTTSSSGGGGSSGGSTNSGGTTNSGGSTNTGGQNTGGQNTGGTTGGGGTGGINNSACEMDVTDASVYQINDTNAPGAIGEGIKVRLDGVIAMSGKILVSHAKGSGSCLWGVFVSAPKSADGSGDLAETAPYSGVIVLSYGPNADVPTMQPCLNHDAAVAAGQADSADVIPDDVKPGDVLKVVGKTSRFIQAACGSVATDSDVKQMQIFNTCLAEKTGATKPVPAAHVVTTDELALIAAQKDAAGETKVMDFLVAWGGTKIRTPAATPKQYSGNTCGGTMDKPCCAAGVPACTVDPYGTITLNEGDVLVPDSLYYLKSFENGAGATCHVGPKFSDNPAPQWAYVQGFPQLNFCTWSLDPTDKCADYSPAPTDCAGTPSCF